MAIVKHRDAAQGHNVRELAEERHKRGRAIRLANIRLSQENEIKQ